MPAGARVEQLDPNPNPNPDPDQVSAETAAATWVEIGGCVARTGVRKLVLYNSHGGNQALAEVVAGHPTAVLVSDEIYEDLVYPEIDPAAEPFSPGSMPELADRTVTLNGLSKSMAMTGWRIGWAVAPGDDGTVAKAMTRLQSQMTSGIPTFLMPAAVRAIETQAEDSARMREVFAGRARLVADLLAGIDRFRVVPPSGAFYAFPDISDCFGLASPAGRRIDSASSFAEALLEEADVAVVAGDDFGEVARSHVRISFACSDEQIRAGLDRIRTFVDSLA